jgi:hypothetical protein
MAKYAATAADITDAFTGSAAIMQIVGQQIVVEGTLGEVESAIKAAQAGGSLANFAELQQGWILSEKDGAYGFDYWKKLGPVRVAPAQALLIRKQDVTPVQRDVSTT